MTDLTTVVVSYNAATFLERCLESIVTQAGVEQEVVVVDNASSDGSADVVRERLPGVRLIANARNVGFGAACNQAMRAAAGRYIALVNPDCEVAKGSLPALVAFMDAHPRAAVAGGRLQYPDGSFQHSSFRFPTLAQVFLDVFPLHPRLGESRLNGRYPREWDERPFEIDHPLGAFFCVRREASGDVGLFDERFFMYVEEVDWCYRLKQAGWEVWHCPDALAVHHGGRSTRQQAAAMFVELHRSRFLFYQKHYPVWFRVAARGLVCLGMTRLLVQDAWDVLRRGRPEPDRRQRARACVEVMRL